ncbi:MAG: hypothetical protein EA398_08215 [Deltaproteobacteria bacterium]|nr:MAG: hypothetical protein EA398_08215 [Deltaproteobacteria bacterium]
MPATLATCLASALLVPSLQADALVDSALQDEPEPSSPLVRVLAGATGSTEPVALLEPSWPGLHALARCGREALDASDAPEEIWVRVDLAVQADGSVSDVELMEVIPEMATASLHACLDSRARELVMAAGEGDTDTAVSLRLQLTPEGAVSPQLIPAPRPGEERGAIATLRDAPFRLGETPEQGDVMAIGALPTAFEGSGPAGLELQPSRDCGAAHVRCLPSTGQQSEPERVAEREATLVPGEVTVIGEMEESVFRTVLLQRRRELRECVRSTQSADDLSSGRLSIQVVVSPEGEVAAAAVVERTGGVQPVEACVLQRVRAWEYPEPRGGGIVRGVFTLVLTTPE